EAATPSSQPLKTAMVRSCLSPFSSTSDSGAAQPVKASRVAAPTAVSASAERFFMVFLSFRLATDGADGDWYGIAGLGSSDGDGLGGAIGSRGRNRRVGVGLRPAPQQRAARQAEGGRHPVEDDGEDHDGETGLEAEGHVDAAEALHHLATEAA